MMNTLNEMEFLAHAYACVSRGENTARAYKFFCLPRVWCYGFFCI